MWNRASHLPILITVTLLFPASAMAFLTDTGNHPPQGYGSFVPPARGQSWVDPVFGTRVVRVSDALQTTSATGGGNLTWIMDEYATMSAFNQGTTRFILQHDSYYGLYDAQGGGYLRDLPLSVHASAEPRWSRTDPDVLYFINGNVLKSYDAGTGAITSVRTFGEYGQVSGKGESDISLDGDHLVLAGDNRYVFVYEISTNTKGQVLDAGGRSFDSLYITPNNNVTVTWLQAGTARYTGIELFDRNMVFQRQLTRAGGHMDVTRDLTGAEVLVWTNSADPAPICDNGIVKVRLSDGQQTCLVSLDWSLAVHISAPDGDGTAWISTYAPSDPVPGGGWRAFTNEVFQVKLDGSGVRRFAHHQSRPFNGYNWTARACVSRDGRKVLYASNCGLPGKPAEYTDAYLFLVLKGQALHRLVAMGIDPSTSGPAPAAGLDGRAAVLPAAGGRATRPGASVRRFGTEAASRVAAGSVTAAVRGHVPPPEHRTT